MYLYYRQLVQNLIIEMLIVVLKIIQAAQPPPPPPPLPPLPLLSFTSLGVKEIPKVRGSKINVKVLNEMYVHKIPKTHLEIC